MSDRYSNYLTRGQTGGRLISLFYIVNVLTIIIIRRRRGQNSSPLLSKNQLFVIPILIIGILNIIMDIDVNILRLIQYFMVFYIIEWTTIISSMRSGNKAVLRYTVLLVHLAFMIVFFLTHRGFIPFEINQSVLG